MEAMRSKVLYYGVYFCKILITR